MNNSVTATTLSTRGLERISACFELEAAQDRCAGGVVRIMHGGSCAYDNAFGFQDRARAVGMRADAIFRIASMTKPLVAVAALMLMERGQLALVDPVSRYLPEFSSPQVGNEVFDTAGGQARLMLLPVHRAMTIQDLLRHTSGLTTGLFGGSLVRALYHEVNVRDDQQSNADMVTKLGRLPLMYHPGTTFEYSMSTDVLGRVVEVVSGKDLNRFVQEDIAIPLGMSDTTFVLNSVQVARLAVPRADALQRGPTRAILAYRHRCRSWAKTTGSESGFECRRD